MRVVSPAAIALVSRLSCSGVTRFQPAAADRRSRSPTRGESYRFTRERNTPSMHTLKRADDR